MKILFDCRYTRIGRHDGISRYTASLVTALSRLRPVTMMISDERQLAMLPDLPWVMGPSPTAITEPIAALYVNKFEHDVVFTPMQTMGPWGRKFKLVTTVHDLIYYTHRTPPRDLAWPVKIVWRSYHLWWGFQRGLLNRADAHLADSETTRDLMLRNRLTRKPISVVVLGVETAPLAGPRRIPTERSLVYMGSFMPYKNVELLARSLHSLPGYRLHLMSRVSASDRKRIEALAPSGSLQFHDGATDDVYRDILGRATALVTASRDEGFGLPLVEAMALGTPVVVSDIPIFREIGGTAAGFFDPASVNACAQAITALEDPAEWQRRSDLARERATAFDWDQSAAKLLGVLEAVYEGQPVPR